MSTIGENYMQEVKELIENLRNSGSRSYSELHEDREEAADRLHHARQ